MEKQIVLKQKIQQQRNEIDEFKAEIRNLRSLLLEKNRALEDTRERIRLLEINKRELEESLLREVKKERALAVDNEKQKETLWVQRNSIVRQKIDDPLCDKTLHEFEKSVLSSMDNYLSQKTLEQETSLQGSPLLKKLKEKTAIIEKQLVEELKDQEKDEGYKELQEILKNPLEKTASLGYSGVRKKLKLIHGKMMSQQRGLSHMEGFFREKTLHIFFKRRSKRQSMAGTMARDPH